MESPENHRKTTFLEKLKTPYRLIILNNETLEEKTSFRLSLLNLYMVICTIALFAGVIVVSAIVFTPLKTYLPGYADYTQTKEFIDLNKKVNELNEELQAQILYTETIQRVLTGNHETIEHVKVDYDSNGFGNEMEITERIPEDEMLRKEVDLRDALTLNSVNFSESVYDFQFLPPITGFISLAFDPVRRHYGVDIIAPKDSPVKAIMDGVVFSADWTLQTGNSIGVLHRNNIVSFYKHNAYFLKEPGDQVEAGEVIAIIGNTGTHTDGPHLHFELWMEGNPVNPENFISFQ